MLYDCSDCGAEISSEAVFCPHCGRLENRQDVALRVLDVDLRTWTVTLLKVTIASVPSALLILAIWFLISLVVSVAGSI